MFNVWWRSVDELFTSQVWKFSVSLMFFMSDHEAIVYKVWGLRTDSSSRKLLRGGKGGCTNAVISAPCFVASPQIRFKWGKVEHRPRAVFPDILFLLHFQPEFLFSDIKSSWILSHLEIRWLASTKQIQRFENTLILLNKSSSWRTALTIKWAVFCFFEALTASFTGKGLGIQKLHFSYPASVASKGFKLHWRLTVFR